MSDPKELVDGLRRALGDVDARMATVEDLLSAPNPEWTAAEIAELREGMATLRDLRRRLLEMMRQVE